MRFTTVSAALVFMAIPAIAGAHAGNDDPNVVHACVNNGSNIARIVGVSGACRAGETPAHWNIAGSLGPQGATGAQGAIGPQGPAGSPGAVGPQGSIGPQGATGAAGIIGPEGPKGAAGAKGDIGVTGATGAQGLQGANGTAGIIGPEGPQGATGAKGDIGASGATGAQGPQGSTGAAGAAGLPGSPGSGATVRDVASGGACGPGRAGAQITDGFGVSSMVCDGAGATGPTGATGATGATGPAGAGGYQRVLGVPTPSDATNSKSAAAFCPAGKSVLGGGYVVTAASGYAADIIVWGSYPGGSDLWIAVATERAFTDPGNWSLTAFAICANITP